MQFVDLAFCIPFRFSAFSFATRISFLLLHAQAHCLHFPSAEDTTAVVRPGLCFTVCCMFVYCSCLLLLLWYCYFFENDIQHCNTDTLMHIVVLRSLMQAISKTHCEPALKWQNVDGEVHILFYQTCHPTKSNL